MGLPRILIRNSHDRRRVRRSNRRQRFHKTDHRSRRYQRNQKPLLKPNTASIHSMYVGVIPEPQHILKPMQTILTFKKLPTANCPLPTLFSSLGTQYSALSTFFHHSALSFSSLRKKGS